MTNQDCNLYAHFAQQFAEHSADELLSTDAGRSYSYADIDRESACLARYLIGLGIKTGDRVSVQVDKSPAALSLYLACLRGGFVFHPLNPGYKSGELEYFLGDASPSIVVCDAAKKDIIESVADRAGIKHVHTLNGDGQGSLIDESRETSTDPIIVERGEDDLAALLYSSGTTGVPKGIMLTHGNLLSNARSLVEAWAFTDQDRLLHALPIFHVHGLFVAIGCVLLSGASMRWLDAFNAPEVIRSLPECTVMMGVPTHYIRLLNETDFTADVAAKVRVFICGSAPLREETFAKFESRTGHRILERYGMTETNMNTSNPLQGERRPGTVGLPLPGVAVRIVDESGSDLAANEVGDLQVRGPNVFAGYWQMLDRTAEDFTADGYFNTGDKGRIDADGYVSIVGRAKDVIITGGLNVYPKEVELFIDALEGVEESAVIGVPHADFGEAVVAVVVRESEKAIDADGVIRSTKKSLANFKVPKRVIFVDELPRNSMAKVQKNRLRETCNDLFT
ncbi:MAG: AMP-binding protein [Proteobacteria bacterium]|nr:AMP-binding protein [Pseudomonadota bacterium]